VLSLPFSPSEELSVRRLPPTRLSLSTCQSQAGERGNPLHFPANELL